MILQINDFQHVVNDPALSIDRTARINDVGAIYAIDNVWTITGRLEGTGQADISTKIAALEEAYRGRITRVALLLDSAGNPDSEHVISESQTLDGIHVTKPPHYPIGTGAEYANFRHYSIVVQAAVITGEVGSRIIAFNETVSYRGGGPRRLPMTPLVGPTIIVQTATDTPVFVTQSGSMVSLVNRFIDPRIQISPPLFPALLMPEQTLIEHDTAGRSIAGRGTFFPTRWRYVMVSGTIIGISPPRVRPLG